MWFIQLSIAANISATAAPAAMRESPHHQTSSLKCSANVAAAKIAAHAAYTRMWPTRESSMVATMAPNMKPAE